MLWANRHFCTTFFFFYNNSFHCPLIIPKRIVKYTPHTCCQLTAASLFLYVLKAYVYQTGFCRTHVYGTPTLPCVGPFYVNTLLTMKAGIPSVWSDCNAKCRSMTIEWEGGKSAWKRAVGAATRHILHAQMMTLIITNSMNTTLPACARWRVRWR